MAIPTPETSSFDRALGAQIEFERDVRDWTISRVLERAGISRSTWDRVVSGERSPKLVHLAAIAHAFGLTTSELLRRAEVREERALREGDEL